MEKSFDQLLADYTELNEKYNKLEEEMEDLACKYTRASINLHVANLYFNKLMSEEEYIKYRETSKLNDSDSDDDDN